MQIVLLTKRQQGMSYPYYERSLLDLTLLMIDFWLMEIG